MASHISIDFNAHLSLMEVKMQECSCKKQFQFPARQVLWRAKQKFQQQSQKKKINYSKVSPKQQR